jgi:hypothetical protein
VESIQSALGVKGCALFLIDHASKELEVAASTGLSEEYLKKGTAGFGGVKWLYPSNNWGSRHGILVSPNAKKVTFWTKAENVENKVSFGSGPGASQFNPTGWETKITLDSLSTEWTQHEINISTQVNLEIATKGFLEVNSIFGWNATLPTESSTMKFYVAGITVE